MCIRDRSFYAYVQPLIDDLRNTAGRATFADAAASSAAAGPTLPPTGTFEQLQAVHEARANLGANFRTEPELMAGQRCPTPT
eukprot:7251166-Alexandrium_andersonii.AAC.1